MKYFPGGNEKYIQGDMIYQWKMAHKVMKNVCTKIWFTNENFARKEWKMPGRYYDLPMKVLPGSNEKCAQEDMI